MEKQEKVFADGFMFKMNPNSPEWVIGGLSLKAEDAIQFIQKHTDKGWVNLKINIGKSGKPYVELDTWKPEPKKEMATEESGLPF
jgi:hypothetical protein